MESATMEENRPKKEEASSTEGIHLEIRVRTMDMFRFLMRHIYAGPLGIGGVIFSLAALVVLILGGGGGDNVKTILLILGASLFTVIQPLQLLIKAKQQVSLNPMFKESLFYEFGEEKVVVKLKQVEERLEINWEDVVKVIETNTSIIVYMSTVAAYILPKDQFKQKCPQLKALMKKKLEPSKCKLKA